MSFFKISLSFGGYYFTSFTEFNLLRVTFFVINDNVGANRLTVTVFTCYMILNLWQ